MTHPDATVLGIETSCDETAASVVVRRGDGTGEILSNIVFSQLDLHAAYGGVVPEIAARSHVSVLDSLVEKALADADKTLDDMDAIAATSVPGLIGGLMVGLMTAKALSMVSGLLLSERQWCPGSPPPHPPPRPYFPTAIDGNYQRLV